MILYRNGDFDVPPVADGHPAPVSRPWTVKVITAAAGTPWIPTTA